ncbi:hypothetical protein [Neisseria sp. Ec49-e6-T10]|uniref:hypothetical protein n=1 Tax=Neisseria sp. Ec49-e6-T10 TaxID=3140744 RepID=UPI003EBA0289
MELKELTRKERMALEKKVGLSEGYLYLVATNRRSPSPELSKKINKADSRFKLSDLRPDIWGEQ